MFNWVHNIAIVFNVWLYIYFHLFPSLHLIKLISCWLTVKMKCWCKDKGKKLNDQFQFICYSFFWLFTFHCFPVHLIDDIDNGWYLIGNFIYLKMFSRFVSIDFSMIWVWVSQWILARNLERLTFDLFLNSQGVPNLTLCKLVSWWAHIRYEQRHSFDSPLRLIVD